MEEALNKKLINKISLTNKINLIGLEMKETVKMGTVSSRGQISIPLKIRKEMGLKEGSNVIFFFNGDSLVIKNVKKLSWEEITKPLREAPKKIKEDEVVDLIHRLRKKK